jgi:hypothetical protein
MGARSKDLVFGRSPADTVGSIPAGGIDACLLFIVLCCQV